jgi:hypothetical protein
MSQILCIKLQNGDEIIGRHVERVENELQAGLQTVVLKQIRQVIVQQVGQGQFAPALMPWIVSNQDVEVEINLNLHGLAVFLPLKAIETSYIEQTSSIKVASKPGIALS